ncbi:FBP domain-containing protein [Streptomyces sp. NPDC007088]|uniref:FBP domain-containing protein n=1 Tax=Streptomyces sp. NPDC007088 TaxID=3364773 RepID=UPI00367F9FB7
MEPLTESGIRTSFVNCTKGEAARLHVPRSLGELRWGDLDFLGWRDPAAPDRGYLVVPGGSEGARPVGVALRATTARHGAAHRGMCSVCLTTHPGSGVALMAARKAGPDGRKGDSVGVYLCADLDCPLYVRRIKVSKAVGGRPRESLTLDEQIARTLSRLGEFVDKVRG